MEESKKLKRLRQSLENKKAKSDAAFKRHFDDVRSANGQPLNDKRGGHKTLARWEKQNNALRRMDEEEKKTQRAIEDEEAKIRHCARILDEFPAPMAELVTAGVLTQWRRHPGICFVTELEGCKARIGWDGRKNQLYHKFAPAITDPEKRKIFARTYNGLRQSLIDQGFMKG